MNKYRINFTVLIGFILILSLVGNAQVFTQVNEISASISATGSANMATADDAWALFTNPAGLSRLRAPELVTGFSRPYSQSFFTSQNAVAAFPFKKYGTVAIGYQNSSSTYSGKSLSTESAYTVSHAFYLQKDILSTLAIGYALNIYQVDYGRSAGLSGDGSDGVNLGNGLCIGLDLGISGSLHERSWVGLFVKNLNSPEMGNSITSMRLPRSLAVGFGYEPYYGLKTDFLIFQAIGNQKTQYRAGIEYQVVPWLILRTGINTEPNRIGFGFGITKFNFTINYAYVSHPVLPETHQFSIGFKLAKYDK